MTGNREWLTSHHLAKALLARRDNDLLIEPMMMHIVGVEYSPTIDVITLVADSGDLIGLNDPADQAAIDAAMYSIWLHGNWFWLTKNMTTEEKKAAAHAVERHHGRSDEQHDLNDRELRWWRDEYRHNQHGADRDRMVISADVDVEVQPGQVRRLTITETLGAWAWRGRPWPNMPQSYDFQFESVVRVAGGPADEVVRRLDAAEGRS